MATTYDAHLAVMPGSPAPQAIKMNDESVAAALEALNANMIAASKGESSWL